MRRVIEPVLGGVEDTASIAIDDLQYVRDLGLIAQDAPVRIAKRFPATSPTPPRR